MLLHINIAKKAIYMIKIISCILITLLITLSIYSRAQTIAAHGQLLVDESGRGIFIFGQSSAGKSNLTLLLLKSPALKFIADDVSLLYVQNGELIGEPNKVYKNQEVFIRREHTNKEAIFVKIPPSQRHSGPVKIKRLVSIRSSFLVDKVMVYNHLDEDDWAFFLASWPPEERAGVRQAISENNIDITQIVRPAQRPTLTEMDHAVKAILVTPSCQALL